VKHVDEYRDGAMAERYLESIRRLVTKPWKLMEVCGGQTHCIVRFGIDTLLPRPIELLHGPGCPVCVTPQSLIDKAIEIARQPGVVFCSFGDMLRVPGSADDLSGARAKGADVRVVYGPLDAVELAARLPERQVVFFGVGFETTAPATATAVLEAERRRLENFSLLVSHVLVPPALCAILASPENPVHGFLAAGHVCAVMGTAEYEPIAERYRVPIVVTGFEPLDLLQGVLMCVAQLERGEARVENQYARAVTAQGNPAARRSIERVFRVVRREWRGIAEIPDSGLALAERYADYDAERRFRVTLPKAAPASECIGGKVLLGLAKPGECPAFGVRCTPENPLGAPMVSSEGACAAYFRYRGVAS
jgi:hydrogenase expression/formation protein HypD